MKRNYRTLLAAACSLIVILSAGCAALSPAATRETLNERVQGYMQAQIDGKWERAYSFFDSSSREKINRESYVNRTEKLSYNGFAIREITVLPSEDQATVKVGIDISFMGYDFKKAPQTQTWVKEKGEWFVKAPAQAGRPPFTEQEKK